MKPMKHHDEKGRHSPAKSVVAQSMRGSGKIKVDIDHPLLKHARKAKDGKHYVPDIYRPGKYLRVD